MDSNEFNKIAGAVLGVLVLLMGVSFVGELIFDKKKAVKAGYELPGAAVVAAAPSGAPAAAAEPIAVRLASADAKKGEVVAKKCAACHQFVKDGKNGTGPALWGVVERSKGAVAGFAYSEALKAKAAEKWNYANLDGFLANPKTYLAGTKMAFAGLESPKDRADIIAWLRENADTPAPLPAK
jgi:cytochrome c2